MDRREFVNVLGAAAAAGFPLAQARAAAASSPYDLPLPFRRADSVSLLHLTDCHAQLLPLYYREAPAPAASAPARQGARRGPRNAAAAAAPAPGSPEAYAFTPQDFEAAARRYGAVGGFAHLAALVKRLRASRPGALLLDGGDSWQGSATALWTRGQDMVEACRLLGVDVMTGHWEFTLGAERVRELVDKPLPEAGTAFVAHNVRQAEGGAEVFPGVAVRTVNGHRVAVIGLAYPHLAAAHPVYFTPAWRFELSEPALQRTVDAARARGAEAVVLLSHQGLDADLKLASRVSGIDAILGGHTHDALPRPVVVKGRSGATVVAAGGSHGKFLGVLDLKLRGRRVVDYRYTLLPVFARLVPPDREMAALVQRLRAPHEAQLAQVLARTEGLLWRRGSFNGSWDQLLLDALMATQDAPIALSPGFRWGGAVLPGSAITREHLMEQTATTYSYASVGEMSGASIKALLEEAADAAFHPDPYRRHGEDMVRVGGLSYTLEPAAAKGARISELRLGGQPLDADRRYRVAGWAPLDEGARTAALKPVWELVEGWLQAQGRVAPRALNVPRVLRKA